MTMRTTVMALALAAVAAPAMAQPGAIQSNERRGLLGVSLSCEECFILRAPGRVAYSRRPMFTSVTSSGAAGTAGIMRGDTLATMDGLDIMTPEGFERFVMMRPGVPIRIGVRRGGQNREFTVTPNTGGGSMASYHAQRVALAQRLGAEALRSAFRSPLGWLGMGLECEQCQVMSLGRRQQAWNFSQPPAVLTVDVDGPAHRGGLRRGDTLTAIDGVELTTRAGGSAFANIEPGQRVSITVRRDGRSRQVTLVAVPRPDASRDEVQAFEEYRRMRDSSNTVYRQILTATASRAQEEIRQLETLLRESQSVSAEESRRRISALDSAIRVLRELERQRSREGLFTVTSPMALSWGAAAPVPPGQVEVPVMAIAPVRPGAVYPLRYSGRLGLVNVDVRSPGAPYVQEVGDSLIVIVMPGGGEVRVATRRR